MVARRRLKSLRGFAIHAPRILTGSDQEMQACRAGDWVECPWARLSRETTGVRQA